MPKAFLMRARYVLTVRNANWGQTLNDLNTLHATLVGLDKAASPRKARVVEFARFQQDGKTVVRSKLRSLQQSVMGSFDEADALMLAALWDNRALIISELGRLEHLSVR
jgi:hypothetical protein